MMATGFRARHLSIVGMGLMGGSMALALRDHADQITGIDSCESARSAALEHGFVDHATDDLYEGVNHADVVILAAPCAGHRGDVAHANRLVPALEYTAD